MVNRYLLDAGVIVAAIGVLGVAFGGKVEFPTVLQKYFTRTSVISPMQVREGRI